MVGFILLVWKRREPTRKVTMAYVSFAVGLGLRTDRSHQAFLNQDPLLNMAQRIETIAGPGVIFISETIRDYLPDNTWTFSGSFKLKGIGEDTRIYKLVTGAEVTKKDAA